MEVHAVDKEAAWDARDLGIKNREELVRMLREAAPITHVQGNLRYENYLFNVQDGVLKAVYPLQD